MADIDKRAAVARPQSFAGQWEADARGRELAEQAREFRRKADNPQLAVYVADAYRKRAAELEAAAYELRGHGVVEQAAELAKAAGFRAEAERLSNYPDVAAVFRKAAEEIEKGISR